LTAIRAASGEVGWEIPLGEVPDDHPLAAEYSAAGVRGFPISGGPITTAGGLVFVAGTSDRLLRALDIESGNELWRGKLPRAGIATPMTYVAGGRQFVVVAAGGHGKAGLELGDYVVAFALPSD
jgi:glucose dehydrogenase